MADSTVTLVLRLLELVNQEENPNATLTFLIQMLEQSGETKTDLVSSVDDVNPWEALGRTLRHARERSGRRIKAFAKEIGYSLGHVSGVELGHGVPSIEFVMIYVQAFDLNVDEVKSMWQQARAITVKKRIENRTARRASRARMQPS